MRQSRRPAVAAIARIPSTRSATATGGQATATASGVRPGVRHSSTGQSVGSALTESPVRRTTIQLGGSEYRS